MYRLLKFDKENENGRIYTKNGLDVIPDRVVCFLNEHKDQYGHQLDPNVGDISGSAAIFIKPDGLYADITFYKNHLGTMFKELCSSDQYIPVACGTGLINYDKTVSNYNLKYIFLEKNNSDSQDVLIPWISKSGSRRS